jgi:hypothetical protein
VIGAVVLDHFFEEIEERTRGRSKPTYSNGPGGAAQSRARSHSSRSRVAASY